MRIATAFIAVFATFLGAAHADSYVGLGIGANAPISGTIGDAFSTGDARNARFTFGQRAGNIAVEGSLYGTELHRGQETFHTLSVGLDLKYHLPLFVGLGAYGKAGVHRTWLQGDDEVLDSYAGNSYAFGGGLDYTFALATLYLDYTHQALDLNSDRSPVILDGNANIVSAGVSLHF